MLRNRKKLERMHAVALCVATESEKDDLMANIGDSKVYRSQIIKLYRKYERGTV